MAYSVCAFRATTGIAVRSNNNILCAAVIGGSIVNFFGCPADGQIMERLMQSIKVNQARESCLRFIFSDAVVSLSVAANATFEDIARMLGELSNQRCGIPVAIDLTLPVAIDITPSPANRAAHYH